MSLITKLKEYKFSEVLKTYSRSGILLYAFFVFLMIKKDKKGLEQFREIMNSKIYLKLYKKNRKKILNTQKVEFNVKQGIPNKVWFCWFQGIENAPDLVKKCLTILRSKLKDYEIIVITENNYNEYSNIPSFIIDKWKKGIITHTHFSDILRNNLLLNHGGYWIDSTVFISEPIPNVIQQSAFFLFQSYKPGCDGKRNTLSSWFIGSAKDNPVLLLAQELLFNYWQKKNYLLDYFLYHNYLQMSLNYYSDISNSIIKYTNETAHYLLFELKNKYNKDVFDNICSQTFAHKLTYKFAKTFDCNEKGTYYDFLLNHYEC